jgi:hypothetical protein
MANEKKIIKCAECGKQIGPGVGIDIYKHTVHCFHLPDIGVEQLLRLYSGQTSDYARRIVQNLKEV